MDLFVIIMKKEFTRVYSINLKNCFTIVLLINDELLLLASQCRETVVVQCVLLLQYRPSSTDYEKRETKRL